MIVLLCPSYLTICTRLVVINKVNGTKEHLFETFVKIGRVYEDARIYRLQKIYYLNVYDFIVVYFRYRISGLLWRRSWF